MKKIIYTIVIIFILGVAPSVSAQNGAKFAIEQTPAANPASIMQILMLPQGAPIDKCILPQKDAVTDECNKLINTEEPIDQMMLKKMIN